MVLLRALALYNQEFLVVPKQMNNTYKFHTDKPFDFNKFIRDKAEKIVDKGLAELKKKGMKIDTSLKPQMIKDKAYDMTVHLYYSGRFTGKDYDKYIVKK